MNQNSLVFFNENLKDFVTDDIHRTNHFSLYIKVEMSVRGQKCRKSLCHIQETSDIKKDNVCPSEVGCHTFIHSFQWYLLKEFNWLFLCPFLGLKMPHKIGRFLNSFLVGELLEKIRKGRLKLFNKLTISSSRSPLAGF